MRPVTVTEFSKERVVSRARVYQWLDDGRIQRLEDRSIDADDAHARLNALLDQSKGVRRDGNVTSTGPAAPTAATAKQDLADQGTERRPDGEASARKGDGPGARDEDSDYWDHRTRSAKADAQLKEMQVLERAGALTLAAGVAVEARETMRATRNALLAIPDRLAPVLDPASPSRAHKLLTEELQKVIRELNDRLAGRAAEASAAREPDAVLV
jgi:hypothetical protein